MASAPACERPTLAEVLDDLAQLGDRADRVSSIDDATAGHVAGAIATLGYNARRLGLDDARWRTIWMLASCDAEPAPGIGEWEASAGLALARIGAAIFDVRTSVEDAHGGIDATSWASVARLEAAHDAFGDVIADLKRRAEGR